MDVYLDLNRLVSSVLLCRHRRTFDRSCLIHGHTVFFIPDTINAAKWLLTVSTSDKERCYSQPFIFWSYFARNFLWTDHAPARQCSCKQTVAKSSCLSNSKTQTPFHVPHNTSVAIVNHLLQGKVSQRHAWPKICPRQASNQMPLWSIQTMIRPFLMAKRPKHPDLSKIFQNLLSNACWCQKKKVHPSNLLTARRAALR